MRGTGLVEREVRKLSRAQRLELVAWSLTKVGGDKIQPFLPNAVRWTPLELRLELARDVVYDSAWEERERRRVREGGPIPGWEWVPPHAYFTAAYGHLRPPTGPAIPFDLWPEQLEVLLEIREHLRQVWLKARQLGMTWLALHDAFHLLAFDEDTPLARILALSKHGGDASKLIVRARSILDYCPPYLRPDEASDTKRSMTRFGIIGRGEMVSLAGTPDAPRGETAGLAILDEFGFVKNRQAGPTWTSTQATLGPDGRAIILSTGNGPAEAPGDGQAFATLVVRSRGGAPGLHFVFLRASVDPHRRGEEWRSREADNYLTQEEFEAEHPESVEEALQGLPGSKVYPPAGINAAERLGRAFDHLRQEGELPPPAEPTRSVIPAIDWGEQTHGLELYPLERGGFYVVGEVVQAHEEPEKLVEPLLGASAELAALHAGAGVGPAHFDAAGVQSMRTFLATARRTRWPRLESISVPFGDYKQEAVRYTRRLLRRSLNLVAGADRAGIELVELLRSGWDLEAWNAGEWGDPPPLAQVAAVSPAGCPELLRQMRGLSFADDDSGKVDKGDDHGPDALLAGVAPTARRFRAAKDDVEPELDPAED